MRCRFFAADSISAHVHKHGPGCPGLEPGSSLLPRPMMGGFPPVVSFLTVSGVCVPGHNSGIWHFAPSMPGSLPGLTGMYFGTDSQSSSLFSLSSLGFCAGIQHAWIKPRSHKRTSVYSPRVFFRQITAGPHTSKAVSPIFRDPAIGIFLTNASA